VHSPAVARWSSALELLFSSFPSFVSRESPPAWLHLSVSYMSEQLPIAGTMVEARDVSNHLLFEVATEVANRGTQAIERQKASF
jgi:hypothetical protein